MHRRRFLGMTAGAASALTLQPWARAKEDSRPPTAYPDAAVEIVDPRFAKYVVINAAVERLYTGTRWAEGPVWVGDGRYLLFSDIPNNRILRWLEDTGEISVFRNPSNYSNGNSRDRQGRLLTCEHDSRRLTRTEHDGTITVLVDHFQGKPLNAPNDLTVHSDGAIWFTDPGYGIMSNYEGHKAKFELPANVYRLDPETREATVVVGDMIKPNGICFSPDEKKLYIVDTGPTERGVTHPINVYDVEDGKRLKNGAPICRYVSGIIRRYSLRCRRQRLERRRMGSRRLQRRTRLRARRYTHWQDSLAGNLREPLLRRRQEEPAIDDRQPIALCSLCQHGGRRDALGPKTERSGPAPVNWREIAITLKIPLCGSKREMAC